MSESISQFKRTIARLRGTVAEEIPAPFDIRCDCGRAVTGIRSASWEQISCPECRTALFLLPSNVYPSTASVGNDVIGGTFGHRLKVVVAEVLPGRRRDQRMPDGSPPANGTVVDKAADGSGTTEKPPPKRLPRISLPTLNPAKIARRVLSPFRLLVMGMILVLSATGYWIYHRSQHEAARKIWHDTTDAVEALVEQGEFERLEETLSKATAAGRLIGQDGDEWRQILNLFHETQALTAVSFATLPSLLAELSTEQPLDDQELQSFTSDLTSGTFVIDGYIDPVGNEPGDYLLDIPAMSGEHPVSVSMQLPQLDDYMEQNADHRLVFAFRLGSVEQPVDAQRDAWQLVVAAESFVLLTSEEHCRQLGFSVDSDPSLAVLLASQQAFVEESDRWAGRHQELADQLAREQENHE
ncbi:MAG: hypothetical protein ABGZ35_16780 [Planctomycetaceae bacterium]|jgi:hypothetical protein